MRFAHGVGNGLDALKIALSALGIESCDEVIVPSNTFIATWLAASNIGCKIRPLEPNWETHVLDVKSIQGAITASTKCLIYVTLYGNSDDLNVISKICKEKRIKLIIDAAQSHGTKVYGRGLGEFGDAVCYSFYPEVVGWYRRWWSGNNQQRDSVKCGTAVKKLWIKSKISA